MNRLSKQEVRRKFDEFAQTYDSSENISEFFLGRYRRKLLSHLNGKILEVGVGTGVNLKYYQRSCHLACLDFSSQMLSFAKKKAGKLQLNAKFIQGDAEKLPFKKGEFDFVVDTLGLCTYPNPIKAIKEMIRVCKKNGKILLLEHGESNSKLIQRLLEWHEPNHYGQIGCTLLRNHGTLARKAGLRIINLERRLFGMLYIIVASN
jgi:ubiquinone/menaquinone biosynthesis C-methylase UbiE